MRDPVVPLVRALYGHPYAGGYWERHCDAHLRSVGFALVHDNWPSTYFHDELKLLLMVYVDDIKMSGPDSEHIAQGWKFIRQGITTGDPTGVGKCLGCKHVVSNHTVAGQKVRVMEYDVCDFMKQCVTAYK